MLARPAKGKLVKLARACLPPGREPNSRSGAVTTVTLAIRVAAQIGGYSRARAGQRQSRNVTGLFSAAAPARPARGGGVLGRAGKCGNSGEWCGLGCPGGAAPPGVFS